MKTLLETIATLPASQPLFAQGSRVVTAGQIRQTAADIADRLADDSPVYLHTLSASLFLAGLLAASTKGLAVALPAHLQPDYLREIGADRRVILTDQRTDVASALPIALAAGEAPPVRAGERDLSMLFFTSGVTGVPKEVVKSIAQLDREAWTLEAVWGARAGRVYATVSHQHIYGMLFRIFWPVIAGRVSEDRAADYWEHLSGKLVPGTTLVSSPAHLTRLAAPAVLAGAAPELIFSSSAPLPREAAGAARDLLGSLPIEVLGSTETGGIAWRQQKTADEPWTPLPGVRIDADDAGGLLVRSPFTLDDTIATGDLVERSDGHFRLLGRADRIAKIDGKRVSLERVEQALLALPLVAAVAAVDLPHFKGALGAVVELNEEGRAALEKQGAFRLSRALRANLAGRLEPSERPKHWRFAKIPLDRQGKRVRAALRRSFDVPREDGPGSVTLLESAEAQIEIALSGDLVWFKGHFPDEPVLPGIAQVHLAVQWAERLWDWRPAGANLLRLKFRHIVRPGRTMTLSLKRDVAKGRLEFAYQVRDVVVSEGIIGGEV
ncbi:MAG TPA: AMP-binding protein [Rhizomicrobium sp.]|nr:AMP-binding protein [Rhizomicrobium sp.]